MSRRCSPPHIKQNERVTESQQLRQLKTAQFYQLLLRSHFLPFLSANSWSQESSFFLRGSHNNSTDFRREQKFLIFPVSGPFLSRQLCVHSSRSHSTYTHALHMGATSEPNPLSAQRLGGHSTPQLWRSVGCHS